jgi:hypothetical protein
VEICEEMLEEFVAENEHHRLLREYLLELRHKLPEMLQRGQDLYTLTLSGPEAMAFYQLWNLLDISRDRYAKLVVDNLLEKMSSLAA